MRPLSRIQEILVDIPPESIPDSVLASLQKELKRAQNEYSHLKTKYDLAIQGKAVVHSLLQKSSEEMIERYRALFEYSGLPMVILSEDGVITLANSHFVDYTGISLDEIINKIRFFDLIESTDREKAVAYHLARRRHERVPAQYEIRFQGRFPTCRDVSLSVGLLPGGTESLVSLTDFTEQKNQKTELSAHTERLEILLNMYQMTGEPESVITSFAIKSGVTLTKSSIGFIAFVDEEGEMVTVEAFWSTETRNEKGCIPPRLTQMTVPVDNLPYVRQVLGSAEPLILDRRSNIRRVLTAIVDPPVLFHCGLFIPVIEQDKVVAVICVADKPEDYTPSDQLQLTVLMAGMWRLIVRNRQEEALKTANKKLGLLSSLTRHDIINLLTALEGYIDLSKDIAEGNTELSLYITKEMAVVRSIGEIIAFTREYEMVGINAPVWQEVSRIFMQATSAGLFPGILVNSYVEGVWIYADPLLIRVFSNFIDNSVRHGGKVSRITLSWEQSAEDLTIIYQDNGSGVVWGEKEKIFIRGYGKHTGLGLFLIREIFAITRIKIREMGEPGSGVRFEMKIPRGNFRLLGNSKESDRKSGEKSEDGALS